MSGLETVAAVIGITDVAIKGIAGLWPFSPLDSSFSGSLVPYLPLASRYEFGISLESGNLIFNFLFLVVCYFPYGLLRFVLFRLFWSGLVLVLW